jgi:tRNA threonylcarbamoyladenosine biosynthesis protein TsaE
MKTTTPSQPETRNQKPETNVCAFTTHSPEETFALAKSIGEQLKGGEIFLLSGDLGAGKTVFAKGIGAGLGIDPADVTSPSFTLVNIHEGRLKFYHVDLYRLESDSRLDLGLEEIFEDVDAVTAIEWAERLQYKPLNSTHVSIEYLSDSERKIEIWQSV